MWFEFISGSIIFMFGCIFGIYTMSDLCVEKCENKEEDSQIEYLKNALLTLALLSVRSEDMDAVNYDYIECNGDTYPAINGYSVPDACFEYIISNKRCKQYQYYSDKMGAFQKYIQKKLHTREQISNFFNDFIQFQKEAIL